MAKISMPDRALIDALIKAGIITDPKMVNRIIIDIQGGRVPEVHVQLYGDNDGLVAVVDAIAADMPTFDPAPNGEPLG